MVLAGDQHLQAQQDALRVAGCERVVSDTASGKLARRWGRWLTGAAVAFVFAVTVIGMAFAAQSQHQLWTIYGGLSFVFSCAASSFALMAIFVHFTRRRSAVWDSLTYNAYGIYLVHYAFVSWLQYSLLKFALPGFVKGLAVILAAVLLSWLTTAALRRIRSSERESRRSRWRACT